MKPMKVYLYVLALICSIATAIFNFIGFIMLFNAGDNLAYMYLALLITNLLVITCIIK